MHRCGDPQPFGFVHIDLKHLTSLRQTKSYVFVAIERVTRFVHVEIVISRDGPTIAGCLERFLDAFGHPVHTILRRIAQAVRNAPSTDRNGGKNRFDTHAERNAFIHDFVSAYNRTRLRCLKYIAPIQAMANHTEDNTYARPLAGLAPLGPIAYPSPSLHP